MLTPTISIARQRVVSHGTLVSYGAQEIDFYPLPPPNEEYRIQLIFKTDADNKSTFKLNIVGPSHIAITFINFDNGLGVATANPIYVANLDKEKLLLNIANLFIGNGETGTRVLSYTFFLGGSASV